MRAATHKRTKKNTGALCADSAMQDDDDLEMSSELSELPEHTSSEEWTDNEDDSGGESGNEDDESMALDASEQEEGSKPNNKGK